MIGARGARLAFIAAVIAAIVIAATVFRSGGPTGAGPVSQIGRAAPSFELMALDGAATSPAAYHGRVVLINLWATWCPPCRAEMPDLQRLYARYGSLGFVVLGIDQGESATRAGAFARALGIRYPILLDPMQRYGAAYTAAGLPTTIVLDRAGIVRSAFDGPLSYSQMTAAITPLLGSVPPARRR